MLTKTLLIILAVTSIQSWEEPAPCDRHQGDLPPRVEPVYVEKVHHHVHRQVPNHSHRVFQANLDKRTEWFDNDDANSCATAGSDGNGESVVMAGPDGSNAAGKGENGSMSNTNFKNDRQTGQKSFAQYSDNNGKKAIVADNWKTDTKNNNKAKAVSKGRGASKAVSNTQKSEGTAQGAKGAKVNSVYDNRTKNWRDNWSVHKNKGKSIKARNTWGTDDRMKTAGRAMGIGCGKAKTVSNNTGSVVKAQGNKLSKGDTRHQGKLKQYGNNWIQGKVGNRKFARASTFNVDGQSRGGTSTVAKGKGGIKSFTNRFKGSGGIAKGTCGTKNKAGYKRKQKRNADNWSTDVVTKKQIVYHPVRYVHKHHHDYYRPSYGYNNRNRYNHYDAPRKGCHVGSSSD